MGRIRASDRRPKPRADLGGGLRELVFADAEIPLEFHGPPVARELAGSGANATDASCGRSTSSRPCSGIAHPRTCTRRLGGRSKERDRKRASGHILASKHNSRRERQPRARARSAWSRRPRAPTERVAFGRSSGRRMLRPEGAIPPSPRRGSRTTRWADAIRVSSFLSSSGDGGERAVRARGLGERGLFGPRARRRRGRQSCEARPLTKPPRLGHHHR